MKYEYGVEYETNGEKPDLPDDVQVAWKDNKGNWDGWRFTVGERDWSRFSGFRIVDERYKPKSGPLTDEVSKWHERGELPPVGDECLYFSPLGGSARVEITAHSRRGICFCEVGKKGESYVSKAQAINFRPLPTERERIIEKASAFLNSKGWPYSGIALGDLYDAGMLTEPKGE